MTNLIQCPECQGTGGVTGFACGEGFGGVRTLPCFRCKGERGIPSEWAEWMRIGEAIRTDRIREGYSGRERAQMLGVGPIAYNAVEHGKVNPRQMLVVGAQR